MPPKRSQGGGGKKKKQKTYHCAKENEKSSKGKSSFNVQPDMAGVLVMCTRSKESRAVKEALDILQRYGDELYPVEANEDEEEDNDDDDEDDLEASIAKEVANLKKPKGRKRFANITTGTDCVVFIRCIPPINPVKLVHHMLTDLDKTQTKTTRYISRYLPVEKACQANIEDIEGSARKIFEAHFNQKDDQGELIPRKFAVACRVRNCTKLTRMDVINKLAATVGPGHAVDLNEPELTIVAEVCQVSSNLRSRNGRTYQNSFNFVQFRISVCCQSLRILTN
ncbi:unnamed protein product [Mucor hiemalis]